jgi:hypothetical protein
MGLQIESQLRWEVERRPPADDVSVAVLHGRVVGRVVPAPRGWLLEVVDAAGVPQVVERVVGETRPGAEGILADVLDSVYSDRLALVGV